MNLVLTKRTFFHPTPLGRWVLCANHTKPYEQWLQNPCWFMTIVLGDTSGISILAQSARYTLHQSFLSCHRSNFTRSAARLPWKALMLTRRTCFTDSSRLQSFGVGSNWAYWARYRMTFFQDKHTLGIYQALAFRTLSVARQPGCPVRSAFEPFACTCPRIITWCQMSNQQFLDFGLWQSEAFGQRKSAIGHFLHVCRCPLCQNRGLSLALVDLPSMLCRIVLWKDDRCCFW